MRAARELLKDLEYQVLSGSIDVNVNELVYNTKKVTKESMFGLVSKAQPLTAMTRRRTPRKAVPS